MFSNGAHSCDLYVCSLPPPIFSLVNGKNNVVLSTETKRNAGIYKAIHCLILTLSTHYFSISYCIIIGK